MPLTVGARLGRYEILSAIGAGGMGEVYRARDPRLSREVAIKLLPAPWTSDPDRLGRFEQEARAAAALNHPNILTVHEIATHEDQPYLVSELLKGETLREALKRGPIPVAAAIDYAIQICRGLGAAHANGIVHRDLKPENIIVTQDGTIKILDFGLAKLTRPAPADDSIATAARNAIVTSAGVLLGTVGYMSPEQVRGQHVDQRSDLFSLGVILYEMLSGVRAFAAGTDADTLSAILTSDPPQFQVMPAGAGAPLDRIVRHCLDKQQDRRFQSAVDVAFALDAARATILGAQRSADTAVPVSDSLRRHRRWPWAAAATIAGVAAVAAAWYVGKTSAIQPPQWTGELLVPSRAIAPRISPDGRTLAFQTWIATQNQLAVLTPSTGSWNVLTDEQADGPIMGLSWAPDGSRIYYDRFGKGIYSVPAIGGEPRRILDNSLGPEALPDGNLLFARVNEQRQNQLHRFWTNEQRVEPLPALLPPTAEAWAPPVRVFPDGKEAVFLGRPLDTPAAANQLHVIDLSSGRVRRLAPALTIRPAADYFALSVSPSGTAALVDVPEGDLHHIVALPRDGSNSTRRLLTLTNVPWFLDAARDGSIYIDQVSRPFALLRFPQTGGIPEQLAVSPGFHNYYRSAAVPLPDGRVVVASRTGLRERLLVTGPNGALLPFVETNEETSGPAAVLGPREIAFLEGSGTERRFAVATMPDDRIVRRIYTPAGVVTAVAASPDGQTLYAVVSKTLWAIPTRPGGKEQLRRVGEADGVAVDPRTGDLIVQAFAADGSYRLYRRSSSGSLLGEIVFSNPLFLTYPVPLSPNAVGPDGRILVHGGAMDTWNFRVGIVDPKQQTVTVVPLRFDGDPAVPAWTRDGQIVSVGLMYRQNLWRFTPDSGGNPRKERLQ
jgi:serine/threonine protein kinase